MKTTATYTPPPPVEGTVTVTMPASTASKLRALLASCNNGSACFDAVETAISSIDELPRCSLVVRKNQTGLLAGLNPWKRDIGYGGITRDAITLDLLNTLEFIPD